MEAQLTENVALVVVAPTESRPTGFICTSAKEAVPPERGITLSATRSTPGRAQSCDASTLRVAALAAGGKNGVWLTNTFGLTGFLAHGPRCLKIRSVTRATEICGEASWVSRSPKRIGCWAVSA